MATQLTAPPPGFIAGDTLTFTASFPEYSAADGWAATWYFQGPAAFSISSAASGSAHAATLSAAASAALTPGEYAFSARVTKGSEKRTAATGFLRVCRDPATAAAHPDYTAWQNALAAYKKLAAGTIETASENGKTYTLKQLPALRAAVADLKNRYLAEIQKDRLALGGARSRGNLAVRFANA